MDVPKKNAEKKFHLGSWGLAKTYEGFKSLRLVHQGIKPGERTPSPPSNRRGGAAEENFHIKSPIKTTQKISDQSCRAGVVAVVVAAAATTRALLGMRPGRAVAWRDDDVALGRASQSTER